VKIKERELALERVAIDPERARRAAEVALVNAERRGDRADLGAAHCRFERR
jgi:hypothetical protein